MISPRRPETMHVCAQVLTYTHNPELDTSAACNHQLNSVTALHGVDMTSLNTLPRALIVHTEFRTAQSKEDPHIHTHEHFIASLHSPAQLNCSSKGNTTFVLSILLMTLHFHTSLTSCLHHTSCPCILRLGVSVQAGPNRLQQHPKQSLFQMKKTYGGPFISSFYFHPCRSAECIAIFGKHCQFILHLQNLCFPHIASGRR